MGILDNVYKKNLADNLGTLFGYKTDYTLVINNLWSACILKFDILHVFTCN